MRFEFGGVNKYWIDKIDNIQKSEEYDSITEINYEWLWRVEQKIWPNPQIPSYHIFILSFWVGMVWNEDEYHGGPWMEENLVTMVFFESIILCHVEILSHIL